MARSEALFFYIPFGAALGVLLAVILAPEWLATMANSLGGATAKGDWYLPRASGVVAYLLLWGSVLLGLIITSRLTRLWPGGQEAVAVHHFVGLLVLSMVAVHVLMLRGDRYIAYPWLELLLPFAAGRYRRLWVGLGQVGASLAAVVALSFYIRRAIGSRTWRLVHYSSFVVYLLVLAHGLGAGTDANAAPLLGVYAGTRLLTYSLTVYGLLVSEHTLHR
jgi:predicted ferric reductase